MSPSSKNTEYCSKCNIALIGFSYYLIDEYAKYSEEKGFYGSVLQHINKFCSIECLDSYFDEQLKANPSHRKLLRSDI